MPRWCANERVGLSVLAPPGPAVSTESHVSTQTNGSWRIIRQLPGEIALDQRTQVASNRGPDVPDRWTSGPELTEALASQKETFDAFSANVDKEMAEAQGRLDNLQAQRAERTTGEIKSETLELYSKLIQARDGDAMAELDGRVCQGCYMEVPANFYVRLVRGSEILQCPSCDRILYSH